METSTATIKDLTTGFVVAINITAKEGMGDEVAQILEDLIEPTMAEEGVKMFLPCRSPTDPSSFFVYELYRDEAGWDAHNKAPHFLQVVDRLVELAAHRERVPFAPIRTA